MADSRRAHAPAAIHAALTRHPARLLRRAAQAFKRLPDARDVEALHDFRVALRRLRTWLRFAVADAAASQQLARALGQLARDTNRARDLEIELEWLLARRAHCERHRRVALNALIRDRRAELRATNARVRRELTVRWPELARAARRDLHRFHARNPAAAVADTLDALEKALRAIGSRRDATAIHRARIRAKRVRYLLEPFRELDAHVAEAIAALVRIQDDFGSYHDREAIRDSLRASPARRAAPELIAWLRGVARAEQRALFEHCERDHLRRNIAARARQLRAAARIVRRALRGTNVRSSQQTNPLPLKGGG